MPELPEIEFYRRLAEGSGLNRTIFGVVADDSWFLKRGTTAEELNDRLVGSKFDEADRNGKLLLLRTDRDDMVGLRFGMTGTLVVDGVPGVYDMKYGSRRFLDEWNRFLVKFDDGGWMAINDPRRLGGVELNPDMAKAGIDALTITADQVAGLRRGSAPLKAWIMDQSHIAGIGNLIADELLWRAGLDPRRPANSLPRNEILKLGSIIAPTVAELVSRGGCHMGDLVEERKRDGYCPEDGKALQRETVGGRTTYFCPKHQK